MVYKSINGLALEYLSNLFTNCDSVTSNSLRDTEGKLAIPQPQTNYLKNSFGQEREQCCGIASKSSCGRQTVNSFKAAAQRVLRSNSDGRGDARTFNLLAEDFFGFRNVCQLCCAKVLGDDFFQGVNTELHTKLFLIHRCRCECN